MPREITTANQTEMQAASLTEVWFVRIDFTDPVFAHTHIGELTWGGNTYVGVGHFGNISELRESDLLTPNALQLELSGLNVELMSAALDATEYGATTTLWQGFLSDGVLVDDPTQKWSGWAEFAQVKVGSDNRIVLTAQHDLADIDEAYGRRYSDEDQQAEYSGDVGFEYVTEMAKLKLAWAGGAVNPLSSSGPTWGGKVRSFVDGKRR